MIYVAVAKILLATPNSLHYAPNSTVYMTKVSRQKVAWLAT